MDNGDTIILYYYYEYFGRSVPPCFFVTGGVQRLVVATCIDHDSVRRLWQQQQHCPAVKEQQGCETQTETTMGSLFGGVEKRNGIPGRRQTHRQYRMARSGSRQESGQRQDGMGCGTTEGLDCGGACVFVVVSLLSVRTCWASLEECIYQRFLGWRQGPFRHFLPSMYVSLILTHSQTRRDPLIPQNTY